MRTPSRTDGVAGRAETRERRPGRVGAPARQTNGGRRCRGGAENEGRYNIGERPRSPMKIGSAAAALERPADGPLKNRGVTGSARDGDDVGAGRSRRAGATGPAGA